MKREIMPLSKTRAGVFAGYRMRKHRDRDALFVAEGEKAVADIAAVARPEVLVVAEGTPLPAAWEDLFADAEIFSATPAQMAKISTLSTPSPFYALFRRPESRVYDGEALPPDLYLMLDGVRDPGNLGTIVRTAHWFGVRTVFASPDTADLYNPKTVMSTMGSLGHVEVVYADLPSVVVANPRLPVFGLLLDGESIYRAPLAPAGFVVMGNEGKGLSPGMREFVSHPLLIPPANPADHSESLNVAVATAVTLSQFRCRSAN